MKMELMNSIREYLSPLLLTEKQKMLLVRIDLMIQAKLMLIALRLLLEALMMDLAQVMM